MCPHSNNGHYTNCDGAGKDQRNTIRNGDFLGPGKAIDTNKPFHVKFDYHKDGSRKFTGFTVTYTQGRTTKTMSSTSPSAYTALNEHMHGNMAFVISNFKPDGGFHWLWDNKCSSSSNWCKYLPDMHMKNIKIRTGNGKSGL